MIIALTGGIGSGKSEAARHFAALGVPVVDTDVISHALTAQGAPMLAQIANTIGTEFISAEQTLDRAKLRAHVFANPAERLKLEALLHPTIRATALQQLTENASRLQPDYQILVVPLLFEGNSFKHMADKTLVIDCAEETQIARTMARSGLSAAEVQAIIAAQATRATRRQLADLVIENNGSVDALHTAIDNLHKKLIKTCIVSK